MLVKERYQQQPNSNSDVRLIDNAQSQAQGGQKPILIVGEKGSHKSLVAGTYMSLLCRGFGISHSPFTKKGRV